LWPLSWYFERRYCGTSFRLKLELGNQPFDAKILNVKDETVECVEVTWPIDGQKHAAIVGQLKRKGYGGFEAYENPLEKIREVSDFTILGARKKSTRDYRSDAYSTLALIVDLVPYYNPEEYSHRRELAWLVDELSKINWLFTESCG